MLFLCERRNTPHHWRRFAGAAACPDAPNSIRRTGEALAFPWRGRQAPFGVTDEVEGCSVVPTYGDDWQLRPHQSALAGCQLPLHRGAFSSVPVSRYVDFYCSGNATQAGGACPRPYKASPALPRKFNLPSRPVGGWPGTILRRSGVGRWSWPPGEFV